jgi:alpha-tubulin suppressor-like RCC1 family protein
VGRLTDLAGEREIRAGDLTEIIWIAADGNSSYALKTDGTVWAWGDNSSDQLGNPELNGNRSTIPVQVAIAEVVFVAAGGQHALAIKSDGTAWAWGRNNAGQLGDGSGGGNNSKSATPVQVSNLTGVQTLAAGFAHSLGTVGGDEPWAWGYNGCGQLGDGTTSTRLEPVQVVGFLE